jgi:hypothetical protein
LADPAFIDVFILNMTAAVPRALQRGLCKGTKGNSAAKARFKGLKNWRGVALNALRGIEHPQEIKENSLLYCRISGKHAPRVIDSAEIRNVPSIAAGFIASWNERIYASLNLSAARLHRSPGAKTAE